MKVLKWLLVVAACKATEEMTAWAIEAIKEHRREQRKIRLEIDPREGTVALVE